MLTRTHEAYGGLDGVFINIKDTTTLQDYIDEGIDISTDFNSGNLELTERTSGTVTNYAINQTMFNSLRDVNGLNVTATDLSLGTITDDLYDIVLTLTFSATGYDSTTETLVYGTLTPKVLNSIIDSNWREQYRDINSYLKDSIKIKSWYDNMKYSEEAGLPSEGLRLLKALEKVVL